MTIFRDDASANSVTVSGRQNIIIIAPLIIPKVTISTELYPDAESFLFNKLYMQNTIAAPIVHSIPGFMESSPFQKRSSTTPEKERDMEIQPFILIFSLYKKLHTIAVSIGVAAMITLDVAAVIVAMPVLKNIK